jgi:hypothetical protein
MTTSAWLRRYRDRPLAAHERRAAIRAVTLLLATATIALLLTRPPAPTTRHADSSLARSHVGEPRVAAAPGALSPVVQRTVRGFLAGYLSYLYGRGPASQIKHTTAPFTRSLEAHPARVPPGLRALKPRVLRLLSQPAPAGALGVAAIISDEQHLDYRVRLLLTPSRGGLLVSGLDAG